MSIQAMGIRQMTYPDDIYLKNTNSNPAKLYLAPLPPYPAGAMKYHGLHLSRRQG